MAVDVLTMPLPMQVFLMLLGTLIVIFRPDIVDMQDRVQSTDLSSEQFRKVYDFVIIGGGSAGALLANRLSENYTVLLLEAGDNEDLLSEVPYTAGSLFHTNYDWNYTTAPSSDYCLSMNNHQCDWARGKVLGGCSVLNAMLYVRGNKKDYDTWADLVDDEGWNYANVLPYFKMSEDMRDEELMNSSHHGTGGGLTVERFKYDLPITDYLLRAGEYLGYKVQDYNGENQTSFSYSYGTLRDGLRCSTTKAFLRPISKRKNLHVSLNAIVEKILVTERSKKAYGVRGYQNNRPFEIRAKREVILSAGTINSPQLLMLSGIGPRKHLAKMKIPVVHDLPGVGKNLQDHVGAAGLTFTINPRSKDQDNLTINFTAAANLGNSLKLVGNNSGPLYSNILSSGMAFIKCANKTDHSDEMDYPDVQLIFSIASDYAPLTLGLYGVNAQDAYSLTQNIVNTQAYGILPLLLRPRSRGYIKLNSNDPKDAPKIVPNYFKDPHDLQVLVEGIKFAVEKISDTPIMQEINSKFVTNKLGGCAQYDILSNNYWECYARHITSTIFHPVGTCKMGLANDSNAVVDARLKVHGIKNLRVIDASIMPRIVSGNINAPTIMIAEKGAAMIKKDHS